MNLTRFPHVLAVVVHFACCDLTVTAAPASITPDQVSELGLWLAAQDLTSDLGDGQVVLTWPDRSGLGYDAVYEARIPQAGLVSGLHNPPTYKLDAIAGLPAVAFDAKDRQSLILNWPGHALGQKTSGFTAVFMVRPTIDNYGPPPAPGVSWARYRYLFLTHVSNYNSRMSVQVVEGTGEVKLFSRPVPAQIRVTQNSSFSDGEQHAVTDGQWHRIMVTLDYKTKVARIVIDGLVLTRALPPDSAEMFEDVPSPITGIGSTTLGDWLTCEIAEMMCYNRALTVEELQSLDRYLSDKYKLEPSRGTVATKPQSP
jgi:hypothetical protein